MADNDGNNTGIGRTVSWIMSVIAAVVVAMGSFILQGMHARQDAMEAEMAAQRVAITRLESDGLSRERRDEEIAARLRDIEVRLREIERNTRMRRSYGD